MDVVMTKEGSVAMTGNRVSTRSTRKGKNKCANPKKLIEAVKKATPTASLTDGLNEMFKEIQRDSPTYMHYFDKSNKDKNKSDGVFLYDHSRVVLDGGDYIHASHVDGSVPGQYILAQAPISSETQTDFFRMVLQVKPEAIAILHKETEMLVPDGEIKCGSDITVTKDGKEESSFSDTVSVTVKGKSGEVKLKMMVCKGWSEESKPPKDIAEYVTTVRGVWKTPEKVPLIVTCANGAYRSGIFTFVDAEVERMQKSGRIKFMETARLIRSMRAGSIDTMDQLEAASSILLELAKKADK